MEGAIRPAHTGSAPEGRPHVKWTLPRKVINIRFCAATVLLLVVHGSLSLHGENPSRQAPESSRIPAGEAQFTPEQLKDYYLVYENPDVRYLRTVFDAYLYGKSVREDELKLLRKWGKQRLRSKFIVLSREENTFGGTLIRIMFQEKPDKVFVTWVYPEGSEERLTLRRFDVDKFSEEEIRRIKVRYRRFLEDKVHAM